MPAGALRDKRIAVAVGSRGIAGIDILARELCRWLKSQGARPFVFPAMGSHGGATAEGQRKVLEHYGLTPEFLGADVLSSMETVSLGATAGRVRGLHGPPRLGIRWRGGAEPGQAPHGFFPARLRVGC